ncbi:putative cation efflux family protein [Rosellinia necatrix]|uniref:Putative cation efflux family protein n=1 Tax=Rosellinia necatrix TaxID=77044 RepID=A0A1S7UJE9_ROSNE|nr:putative cation efflux family protein [Rosellinia necatrix]
MSLDNKRAIQASSSPPSRRSRSPFHRGGFLRNHDEHPRQGALTQLLRNRSHQSLHNYGSSWRGGVAVHDDEEALLAHSLSSHGFDGEDEHRRSQADERRLSQILNSDPVRSMRLIGNSNPRYNWERYWKTEEDLSTLKKPIREYYERTNYLIQQYRYIDRLLDSSLPHDLLNEYNNLPHSSFKGVVVPETISEETGSLPKSILIPANNRPSDDDLASAGASPTLEFQGGSLGSDGNPTARAGAISKRVKRTPKDIYRPTETTPLFNNEEDEEHGPSKPEIPWLDDEDEDVDSTSPIVTLAIYVNFTANFLLLAGKIAVMLSVSSMSVLASLVDAVLDFLSTVIVWTTTVLISRQDQYKYPVGRRRLEPLGVLVFSVIMITSFVQVALQSTERLASPNHEIIELGTPALILMVSTVVIKGLCWLWCRLVKNSSVQALAADAMTDVIFNTGSILFPIVGFYFKIWWLDALGGLLLSLVVITNWSETSLQHIKNLSGFSATADQRNVLLYLTMRFAKTIRQIQGIQAYHAGDKLNVEVDIILDESTTLRDSHDLSESLGYVLESVPIVDRAFVHADYASYNFPTHMEQQQSG